MTQDDEAERMRAEARAKARDMLPQALKLLRESAQSNDPKVRAEARQLMRDHGISLSDDSTGGAD